MNLNFKNGYQTQNQVIKDSLDLNIEECIRCWKTHVSVDFIKKYIDGLAMLKFNNFHWHLTEDQDGELKMKSIQSLITLVHSEIPLNWSLY